MVRQTRVSHYQMSYIQMVNLLPDSQIVRFNQDFRAQIYKYVPTNHEQKIIRALVADYPRLGKLLKNGGQYHGKAKSGQRANRASKLRGSIPKSPF